MNILKRIGISTALFACITFSATPALADSPVILGNNSPVVTTGNANTGTGLMNPLAGAGINSLPDLLNALLDFAITLGGIAIVVMLVYIGFKFVAAQGNSEKLVEARTMLIWTVIGALILLGAKAIELGIQATVNSLS